jgi:hypothetical protein
MDAQTGVRAARPWLIAVAVLAILAVFVPLALPALGLGLALGGLVTQREADTPRSRALGTAMLVTGVAVFVLSLLVLLGTLSTGGETEVTTW